MATLDENRQDKIHSIKTEATSRMSALIPALHSMEIVNLVVELWPALDTTKLSSNMFIGKDIYVYAKGKIAQAKIATQEQLDAYDPTTDSEWPA